MTDNIFVTKPYMPPLEEFTPYLQKIWDSGILSNCGPFHAQLEHALAAYLGIPFISLFNNGTTPRQNSDNAAHEILAEH